MPRRRVESIAPACGVIALALQSLAGICGPDCSLPGVEVAPATVTEGTLHFQKGAQDGDLPLTEVIPAETGTSTLRATLGSGSEDQGIGATSYLFDDPSATVVHGYFELQVQRQFENDGFSVFITTSDPREWPVGEVPGADVDAQVKVTSFESCDDDDCLLCEADVPDASLRFFVEESTGASDDSTNRVSDDFRRKLRMELELGGPFVPGSCAEEIDASGSATFTWSAADFVWTDGC